MLALGDLENEGLTFDMTYSRLPFFLRGDQGVIDRWMASIGLPPDAPRYEIAEKMNWKDDYIDSLFAQAGLSPRDKETTRHKQMSDTLDSHRLGLYAASVNPDTSERLWTAFARRYFMGKDTRIRPLRLDNREMLLECVEEVGLDLEEARRVLDGTEYRQQILSTVEELKAVGVQSIPVIVFEIEGIAQGNWMNASNHRGREIFQGSGNRRDFRTILQRLHAACGGG